MPPSTIFTHYLIEINCSNTLINNSRTRWIRDYYIYDLAQEHGIFFFRLLAMLQKLINNLREHSVSSMYIDKYYADANFLIISVGT